MANLYNTLDGAAQDAAYQASLAQVDKIRNEMMGSAGLSSSASVTDKQTQMYHAKVKVLSTAYIGVEQVVTNKQEKRTENYYKEQDQLGADYQKQATTLKDSLDTNATDSIVDDDNLAIAAEDNAVLEQQVIQENLDGYYKAIEDANKTASGLPKIEAQDSVVSKNNPNTQKTGYSNLPLPDLQDTEVPAHEAGLGDFYANKVRFEVGTPQGKINLVKGWINPDGSPKQGTYGTPNQPLSEKIAAALESSRANLPGSYKFFIEKLHGKSVSTGEFYKKNPIKAGKTAADYMNRMVFPAYVSMFNDSFNLDWSDYKFIGRSEPVMIYNQTNREFTIEFYMLADYSVDLLLAAIDQAKKYESKQTNTLDAASNKLKGTVNKVKSKYKKEDGSTEPTEEETLGAIKRIGPDWGTGTSPDPTYNGNNKAGFVAGYISGTPEMLWERATFLAQCCYPYYRKDGKLKEQPFVRLRLGDYYDIIGVITSLQFSELDEFQLDLNPSAVGEIPMGLKVALNIKVVHEDEPHYKYRNFYHRKDYDTNGADYLPDSSRETSLTKDSTLDKSKTGSPLFKTSPLDAATDGMPLEARAHQESVANFNNSLAKLGNSNGPQGLNDIKKKEKLKETLNSAKRVVDITKEQDAKEIKNLRPDEEPKNSNDTSINTGTSLSNTPISQLPKPPIMGSKEDIPDPIALPNKKLFNGLR